MAPSGGIEYGGLDDIQVMGSWNFTLQADTPLYWLRCGRLDKYLLKFKVHSPCPSTCGLVLHAEADFGGTDGTSFWIERRRGVDGQGPTKRYLLSGEGLESRPIVTRFYPDDGKDQEDEIEVLMQGYSGCVLVQNRKVQLKFRCKHDKGSIAFYNSTQAERDDIHFSDVRITAMRRGPMEIGGTMGRRERSMLGFDRLAQESTAVEDEDFVGSRIDDKHQHHESGIGQSSSSVSFSQAGQRSAADFSHARSQQQSSSSWSVGSGPAKAAPARQFSRTHHGSSGVLQRTASEGLLRKTMGGPTPFKPSSTLGGKGGKWVAVALNAPASEKQLIRSSMPMKAPSRASCQDFIAMPVRHDKAL
eukprot:TRINITY_DN15985_c0_g1_i1.p1 TRINITY_DN15985_c0_g1~~TRINITY_DN15985_c0_g1_i1.p1  ORF type:complete len:360 (+),score=62.83 TRINITY_DN15985_c0_g1_i1:93-1172(+)